MRVDVVTPPAMPAISLQELQVHARLDDTGDDADLLAKIDAATAYVEQQTGRALVARTVRESGSAFPTSGRALLAVAPVISISSVTVDGTALASTAYSLAGDTLVIPGGVDPASIVVVTYQAGYGSTPASVPADLRQAVLLIAAHWLRSREGVTIENDQALTELPHSAAAILARRGRFFL